VVDRLSVFSEGFVAGKFLPVIEFRKQQFSTMSGKRKSDSPQAAEEDS
jgi:hypothetical protein